MSTGQFDGANSSIKIPFSQTPPSLCQATKLTIILELAKHFKTWQIFPRGVLLATCDVSCHCFSQVERRPATRWPLTIPPASHSGSLTFLGASKAFLCLSMKGEGEFRSPDSCPQGSHLTAVLSCTDLASLILKVSQGNEISTRYHYFPMSCMLPLSSSY